MSLMHDDYTGSDFVGGLDSVKKHYDYEIQIARLEHQALFIVREPDGFAFKADMKSNHYNEQSPEDDDPMTAETKIKYFDSGDVEVDFSAKKKNRYWVYNQDRQIQSVLPSNIHYYDCRDKRYFIYDTNESDVRRMHYDVTRVFEKKDDVIRFCKNGEVKGAKVINRGPTKFAENKRLPNHLDAKHLKELTKARLDSDFMIEYNQLYATFRGIRTGLYHMALEMYRPSQLEAYGAAPNSGMIRRIHVARFIKSPQDQVKAEKLALSIIEDIPDSCFGHNLKRLKERHDTVATV
tara:strand:- start:4058 stop:4936 length:879 start_codon:yes stop_codon:yes gene_type:complete